MRKKGLICIVRVGSVDFCVMVRWLTIVDGRVVVSIQQSKGRGGVLAYFVFLFYFEFCLVHKRRERKGCEKRQRYCDGTV